MSRDGKSVEQRCEELEGECPTNDRRKVGPLTLLPQRIRTYMIVELSIAALMAIVLAVRSELRTGKFFLIDYLLLCVYTLILATIFFGPVGILERYLYRQEKGVWYAWKNRKLKRRLDCERALDDRRYWKNAAVLARLSRHDEPLGETKRRTGLFTPDRSAESVSRPALLMKVANRFESSGKREAADRCYLEITERFASSPQADEAARRLASAAARSV